MIVDSLLHRSRSLEDTNHLLHIPEDRFVLYYCTSCPQDENLASMQEALYDKSYYMCYVAGGWDCVDGEWWRRVRCGDGRRCRDHHEGRVEPQTGRAEQG
jgi:hypothetical protein